MASSLQYSRLVADIGATNARFALVDADGQPYAERLLAVADYPDIVAAINAYLQGVEPRPTQAALAVAMPILGDQVKMTNYERWSFSIEATRRTLGLEKLILLNDFTALALSLPRLKPSELRQVGGGLALAEATIGLIGPGTGLGVSGLVWAGTHWVPLMTEGGHVTLSPVTEQEWKIACILQKRFGHVSTERLLSGPGLVNLYQALAELEGCTPEDLQPPVITERALAGNCSLCRQTVEIFCAMLGTAAGNLAVTLGALGGVYIGGGIVPQLGDFFEQSAFRKRFEAKGRFKSYLAAIPAYVITTDNVALRGIGSILDN
ncbi:MAG: glucokinase [Candidatus Competibacteraceae bacterium]